MKEEVKGGAGLTLATFAVAMIAGVILFAQGAQAADESYKAAESAASTVSVGWGQVWVWLVAAVATVGSALMATRLTENRRAGRLTRQGEVS